MTNFARSAVARRREFTMPADRQSPANADAPHFSPDEDLTEAQPSAEIQIEPEPAVETQPAAPALSLADLASELEAALMDDLQSVSSFWAGERAARQDEAAEETASFEQLFPEIPAEVPHDVAAHESVEAPDHDRLAIQLLLARAKAAEPQADARADFDAVEPEWARPPEDIPAAATRQRRVRLEPAPEPSDAAVPAVGMANFFNRKMLLAGGLVVLIGGGVLLTVQSVTAHTEQAVAFDPTTTASIVRADADTAEAPAKQSYDRAEQDQALSEPPQLRGVDLLKADVSADPVLSPASATATDAPQGTGASPVLAASAAETPSTKGDLYSGAVLDEHAAGLDQAPPLPAAFEAPAAEPDGGEQVAALTSPINPVEAVAETSAPAKAAPAGTPRAGGLTAGPARIVSGVKMRSNPDNAAPIVAVLGPGAAVGIVACKGWCEVTAGDKRGFVFQKFLSQTSNVAASK